MARLIWYLLVLAVVAALLVGASYAVAFSSVDRLLGAPPPRMGDADHRIALEGRAGAAGEPACLAVFLRADGRSRCQVGGDLRGPEGPDHRDGPEEPRGAVTALSRHGALNSQGLTPGRPRPAPSRWWSRSRPWLRPRTTAGLPPRGRPVLFPRRRRGRTAAGPARHRKGNSDWIGTAVGEDAPIGRLEAEPHQPAHEGPALVHRAATVHEAGTGLGGQRVAEGVEGRLPERVHRVGRLPRRGQFLLPARGGRGLPLDHPSLVRRERGHRFPEQQDVGRGDVEGAVAAGGTSQATGKHAGMPPAGVVGPGVQLFEEGAIAERGRRHARRWAASARQSHPARKATPPSGVTAPHARTPVSARA